MRTTTRTAVCALAWLTATSFLPGPTGTARSGSSATEWTPFPLRAVSATAPAPVVRVSPRIPRATILPARSSPEGLLPAHRIVTYYGNPRSSRMGILGALPAREMLARLRDQAAEYERADPATPVLRALHLVTVVAQSDPGPHGLYRARMPDTLVEQVASWAEPDSLLLFLDIQPGRSSVVTEVRAYLEFLKRPRVHLALDPEFTMGPGQVPGREIGSIDAEDVNRVVGILAELVDEYDLPPKVLVVHRFTERMLVGRERVRLDPRVQIVVNMDGFGAPTLKRDSYRAFVASQPVEFTGFKLFYHQDVPLMSVRDVLALRPVPLFIVYQ
jgi:hypothetical protein